MFSIMIFTEIYGKQYNVSTEDRELYQNREQSQYATTRRGLTSRKALTGFEKTGKKLGRVQGKLSNYGKKTNVEIYNP